MLDFYSKIWPLILPLLLGFFVGRAKPEMSTSVAWLLIYLLMPVVSLYGLLKSSFVISDIFAPLLFFLVGSLSCLFAYHILGHCFKDKTRNLLAFTSGTGNTGYFGLPVVLAVFGESQLGLAVVATLGIILYESTLGYYMIARGNFTAAQALKKLLRLPSLWAILFGITFICLNISLPEAMLPMFQNFTGAYSCFGIALIGISLAKFQLKYFDLRLLACASSMKFLVFPCALLLLMKLLMSCGIPISVMNQQTLMLLASTPLAANTVAFAENLDVHPEKAAVAVIITTLLSLVIIPVWLTVI